MHGVTRRDWLAEEFERHRSHLLAVAYRLLGSVTDAEDAVQEAWARLDRRDPGGTDDMRGWLTVVVGRISLDILRSRRARREQYAGSWLPEPILTVPRPQHIAATTSAAMSRPALTDPDKISTAARTAAAANARARIR